MMMLCGVGNNFRPAQWLGREAWDCDCGKKMICTKVAPGALLLISSELDEWYDM